MYLKSEEEIKPAMAKSYPGVSNERKAQLLATIQATRPEKLDELHSIFSLVDGGLTAEERAFYQEIVVVTGDEVPSAVVVQAQPAPATDAVSGKPTLPPLRKMNGAEQP